MSDGPDSPFTAVEPNRASPNLLLLGGIAALSLAAAAVALTLGWSSAPDPPAGPQEMIPLVGGPDSVDGPAAFNPFGNFQPRVVPAAAANVPDDAPVVGVSAGGRHRAYLVTLSSAASYLANDKLGEVPVSVAYCGRRACARAYTAEGQAEPINLSPGGYNGQRMLLRYNDGLYFQDTAEPVDPNASPPLPLKELPAELTTWKAWREMHPDTDVYIRPRRPAVGAS
jgi:hypothetical protein